MFTRISNSWELLKASARVLMADKELLIFPVLSAIALVIVSLTFAVPMFLSNFFDSAFMGGQIQILGFITAFLFYMVQYTVIFFANTALVGAALIRLRGGDPTVADGFRIASSRIFPILGYALIAATVGMILRALTNKSKGLGRVIVSLVGVSWNVATYLVVPVLAVEEVGPVDAIKRSVALLRRTWGEQVAGNLGLGAVFGLFYLGAVLLFAPILILAISMESAVMIIAAFAFLILAIMLISLMQATLQGIYAAAVYQYASTGQTGQFFETGLVKNAFFYAG